MHGPVSTGIRPLGGLDGLPPTFDDAFVTRPTLLDVRSIRSHEPIPHGKEGDVIRDEEGLQKVPEGGGEDVQCATYGVAYHAREGYAGGRPQRPPEGREAESRGRSEGRSQCR